jgi:dinuclear metal center YbgI/SA1388 family protein
MRKASLTRITQYCDGLLRPESFEDWAGAVNGLQVENEGSVSRLAAAVDGSLATIGLAVEAGADLLLVHHGLFWSSTHPWTGRRYQMLRALLDHNLAVYSSHLPLDAHPTLGNNALLCDALRLRKTAPFLLTKGQCIGFKCHASLWRDDLVARLAGVVGVEPKLIPGGPDRCRRIGVVSGGAGDELVQAAKEGVDTFITGEGRHWTYALAEDLGLNILYAGHYATETFGVKALAQQLSTRFHLPWVFLDHPTGL